MRWGSSGSSTQQSLLVAQHITLICESRTGNFNQENYVTMKKRNGMMPFTSRRFFLPHSLLLFLRSTAVCQMGRMSTIGILMVSPSKPADKDAINLDELPLKKHWWDYAEVVSAGSEDLEFTDAGNVRLKTPGRGRAAVDRYGKPVEV